MTEPNASQSQDDQARDVTEDNEPQQEFTDETPDEQVAAATGEGPAEDAVSHPAPGDDANGEDGPDEDAEQVDADNVPAEMAMPRELHAGDDDKKGDELAGDDEDDSWLNDDSGEGGAQ